MIEYSVCENKKLNNNVYVYSPAVNRQKLLSVNLTTNGVSLVPMFFCQWYIVRVWEVLANEITTHLNMAVKMKTLDHDFEKAIFPSMMIWVR